MKKTLPGILLLAVAAFAGWTWWQRRQNPAPAGELAISPNGDTSLLPQLSQVGSNVYQDVTGDLLEKLIASYERVSGGCWQWDATHENGNRHYTNSVTGKGQWFEAGLLPKPLCGGSGAVGQNAGPSSRTEATSSATSALRVTRGAAAQGYSVVTSLTGCQSLLDPNGEQIGDNC